MNTLNRQEVARAGRVEIARPGAVVRLRDQMGGGEGEVGTDDHADRAAGADRFARDVRVMAAPSAEQRRERVDHQDRDDFLRGVMMTGRSPSKLRRTTSRT